MPLSNYDEHFGGKAGSAQEAYDAMVSEYGEEKGKQVFYATVNKRKKKMSKTDKSETDVAKAPSHGRLYDNFPSQATHAHHGTLFDGGFGMQSHVDTHGRLYDLFGIHQETTGGHGERFDDFGWRDMPAIHGQLFDTDFRLDLPDDPHGTTWYDVFRGGRTQARYMFDGRDYEGTVIDCNPEFATVRSHDGQTHEVGLSQFLAYRTPNDEQCAPATPASDAEAPSAHNADAQGHATGTEPTHAISGEMPSRVEHVSEGPGNPDARNEGVPDGLMDTFTRLKTAADEMDVQKDVDTTATAVRGDSGTTVATVGHRRNCPRGGSAPCGSEKDGRCSLCRAEVHDHEAVGKTSVYNDCATCGGKLGKSMASGKRACTKCGALHTANGEPAPKLSARQRATGRAYISQFGKALDELDGIAKAFGSPADALAGGQTTTINPDENPGSTGQAPGSHGTGDLDISVPERDHKTSDHHSNLKSKPSRCPHCGGALEQIDNATRQGQPSRAHKCVGSGLDVLKALA